MTEDERSWLTRLSADDWLRAATKELALARAALTGKHHREGLTYARRAAGMALNAALVVRWDDRYGRSYMDHLKALAADEVVPDAARAAAHALLESPMQNPLVTLGPGPTTLADAAEAVVAHATEQAAASAAPRLQ